MKKILIIVTALVLILQFSLFNTAQAQEHYWVMLTDKAGTTFDPYSYFDAKAIERYQLNHADLYDISNYPLNTNYVSQIDALATDDFGQSRWLNAVAVTATDEQIAAIRRLPFVKEILQLEGDMQLAQADPTDAFYLPEVPEPTDTAALSNQLIRMGGNYFRDKGINGKGVRIAIFDGGFPQVNTHIAFKHLRDEGRILKTWNFPNRKADVYGWNSHGTMTLSCIAGINRYEGLDDIEYTTDLGLATGAEFLLARTEVNSERRKEEVWWQMAVEWADKNGAQIISSSLGYGKDRYYTKDMDGTSLVAKAANMAARKGMLVCNSAGNEGTDKSWLTIITPADADSVLCVGGISSSLHFYDHISFSSYGPSANGRQKPNVVAFGHAQTATTGVGDNHYGYAYGTSFSCPLVAGFAACALQAHPELTAMQLFHEIEKSADLYPYCDYSFGYGVPQADYFTGDRKPVEPTFRFQKTDEGVEVVIPKDVDKSHLFIKNCKDDGTIIEYKYSNYHNIPAGQAFIITSGDNVTIHLNGYTDHFAVKTLSYDSTYELSIESDSGILTSHFMEQHFSTSLHEKNSRWEAYLALGLPVNTQSDELSHSFWSPAKRIGIRRTMRFTKGYGWGFALEYGMTSYRFGNKENLLDSLAGMDDNMRWLDKGISKHRLNLGEVGLEIFQRVRFVPLGLLHKGLHWDLGVYGNWSFNAYKLKGRHDGDIATARKEVARNIDPLSDYRWNWGVTTRLTYDVVGIYARFRLNGIGETPATNEILLPRLEAGIQLAF